MLKTIAFHYNIAESDKQIKKNGPVNTKIKYFFFVSNGVVDFYFLITYGVCKKRKYCFLLR